MLSEPEFIEIRRANETDLAAIAGVLVATWRTTFRGLLSDSFLESMSCTEQRERHTRIMVKQRAIYFVAERALTSEVIGFANGGPNRNPEYPYAGELYAIYIMRDFQGRGIGKRLFCALADGLSRSGLNSMIVWVLANNPNCRFYECMGGRTTARRPSLIDDKTNIEEVAFIWSDLESTLRSYSFPTDPT
jgi:GNAT superfamily N-acetyltransferase